MNEKCFKQFIELLNKKGIIRNIQIAKQITPEVAEGDVQKSIDMMCLHNVIVKATERDEEVKEAFGNAAIELMMNKIMDVIDLKKDDKFEFTPQELFAKELAKVITNGMFKNLEKLFKDDER